MCYSVYILHVYMCGCMCRYSLAIEVINSSWTHLEGHDGK